jgi:hypothetical protein
MFTPLFPSAFGILSVKMPSHEATNRSAMCDGKLIAPGRGKLDCCGPWHLCIGPLYGTIILNMRAYLPWSCLRGESKFLWGEHFIGQIETMARVNER